MIHHEWVTWLTIATSGLPPRAVETICEELTAHYEDALRDYRDAGMNETDAHQAAMNDLGSPRDVAAALREIHAPRRRFINAAVASIAPFLLLLIIAPFAVLVGPKALPVPTPLVELLIFTLYCCICVATIICTPYVVRSFRALLDMNDLLDTPARLIRWGMLALALPSFASFLMMSSEVVGVMVLSNDPVTFFNQMAAPDGRFLLYDLSIAAAVVTLGIGWLMAGIRLAAVERRYFQGMFPLLRGLFMVSGFGLLVMGMSTALYHIEMTHLFSMIVAIVGPIKGAACTLLFYRAAREQNNAPTMMA